MVPHLKLEELFGKFASATILVIGDVMVDEYLWGSVTRISPEAPVPVVSCSRREYRMGGAANVAINIKAMGAEPLIFSVTGNDEAGTIFKSLLDKRGMTGAGIIASPKRQTTTKTRVIGNHQHLLRVDQEMTDFLDPDLEETLTEKIILALENNKIDAIVFQDYDKGVLTPRLIDTVSITAAKKGIPTLVDPKKRSFSQYKRVTLFKPNFKELNEGLNLALSKSETGAILEAARSIISTRKIGYVMVTLSEKGVLICDAHKEEVIPAVERDITDVSGAGDTVISIAALCLAAGLDPFAAARMSNIAGGLVCEKVGVIPITPEMLMREGIKLA